MSLVLRRTPGQRLRLRVGGVDAWVILVALDGREAVLAFEAPEQVEVHREELLPEHERTGRCVKVRFPSRPLAEGSIARLRAGGRARERGGLRLVAYHCPSCSAHEGREIFHAGHRRDDAPAGGKGVAG